MKTNFLLCSSAPWLLWRFQVTWTVTVFNQCSEDSGFNASVCGSYHHSTSCFSFLTGFSHFIFSHFWLNSSEWNWAGVAVGLFKVFCINFFYLYSAGFIFISISGHFSPCFSEAIGLIHRICFWGFKASILKWLLHSKYNINLHCIFRCLQFKLAGRCLSENWKFYIAIQIPTVPL